MAPCPDFMGGGGACPLPPSSYTPGDDFPFDIVQYMSKCSNKSVDTLIGIFGSFYKIQNIQQYPQNIINS